MLVGLHAHELSVAACVVLHQKLIRMLQALLSRGVSDVGNLVSHQCSGPVDSKRSSALPVPIEMMHVLSAMDVEGAEDPLIFCGKTAKHQRDVIYCWNRISAVATLASMMWSHGRSPGEGRWKFTRFQQ